MLQFFQCVSLVSVAAVVLNCSPATAQNCEQIRQQMNGIAANAGWGDLARLKDLEQRYYACQRGGARAAQPPATVKTLESTEYEMKRKNNYCGTDGVYTFYCPKRRACLHKNASGCAPAAKPLSQEQLLSQAAASKRRQEETARRKYAADLLAKHTKKHSETKSDRWDERHKKGLEYLRDSPEVKEIIASIQSKTAALAVGGVAGYKTVDAATTLSSVFEGVAEFERDQYKDGTVRLLNSASSFAVETLGLPPGSSDVLNLSGAATTAYLYGFFKGL